MPSDKIEIRPYKLGRLFALIDECKLAVPQLQREFVWNAKKACKLLDSIDRNYPIGTAMIWPTGRENRSLLRLQNHFLPPFNDARNKEIFFIIDGQQRLSVLHQVRRGECMTNHRDREIDFGSIHFDLRPESEDRFVSVKRPDPEWHFRVADILAANWRQRVRHLPGKKRREVEKFRARFFAYEMFLVFTPARELESVRETFIRINAQGTPIDAADRAFARASRIDLRGFANEVRHGLSRGFDQIKPEVVLSAFALIHGEREIAERAIERVVRHVDGTDAGVTWHKRHAGEIKVSFEKAVDYLIHDLDVLTFGLLPSQNMVSLLALFFFHNRRARPNGVQRRELQKWFWATAVCQRYSGRGFRANVASDAEFFTRLGKQRRGRFVAGEPISLHDLRLADYSRRSSLTDAFYLMLAVRKPRYLEDGETIPIEATSARANAKQRHHIFPRALLARQSVPGRETNSIGNICFIVAQHNQSIGSKRPNAYLEEFRRRKHFARVMNSHLIPHRSDSPIWDDNIRRGFRAFLTQRLKLISEEFEARASIRLFRKEK
ncbi:MAG: DUF262 domain-containing protein [Verrucomicrobia bacterium]|nr:DUF262 domain-containing protein [Verrucomicrobiota bacterium]